MQLVKLQEPPIHTHLAVCKPFRKKSWKRTVSVEMRPGVTGGLNQNRSRVDLVRIRGEAPALVSLGGIG